MFVGRKKELAELARLYKADKFQCVMVYGCRRIGKTTLIIEFIKDKVFQIVSSCVIWDDAPYTRTLGCRWGIKGSHIGLPLQTVQRPNVGAALRGRPLSAHCQFDID